MDLRFIPKIFHPTFGFLHQYEPRALEVNEVFDWELAPDRLPTFAIVTPSFNQGRFIAQTIRSVLDQNYPYLSYFVQDGGSADNTVSILRALLPAAQWASHADAGQSHALNMGFKRVAGDLMGYLNSDDILLPGTLMRVASVFDANPDIDFVYGDRICIDVHGREIGRWVSPQFDARLIKWFDYIPQETLFWRRRAWESLGGFDEQFDFALDWDFILRAQAQGFRFLRIPHFLGGFRIHREQKTLKVAATTGHRETLRLRTRHIGFAPPRFVRRIVLGTYLVGEALRKALSTPGKRL